MLSKTSYNPLRLIDAKVNNLVTNQGREKRKIVFVGQRKGPKPNLLEVPVHWNFAKRLMDEAEERWLVPGQEILVIETMTLPQMDKDQELIAQAVQAYLNQLYTFTESNIEINKTLVQIKVDNLKVAARSVPKLE